MNMSFGVQAAPPATGEVGVADPLPASATSSASSTPLPPAPAPFSMPSVSFTFQGPSGNVLPPSRPPSAPAGFPFTGAPPRFTYPNAPATVPPSAVPPSASPVPPFSVQPGFTFPSQSGNPGQPMVNMGNPQPGAVGQSPAVGVRPLPPTGMQASVPAPSQGVVPLPLQATSSQGSQAILPGSTISLEAIVPQGASMPTVTGAASEASSAAPPGSLQVPGVQARMIVPPSVTPSITGLPGQVQMPAVPPPVGAIAAVRPGLPLPTSNTLPYIPPRPTFTTTPVAGAAIVPSGDLRLSMCYYQAIRGEPSLWPLF